MATDLSVTVQESFRQVTMAFLGTGTMVVCLKHVGITDWVRERLKMSQGHFHVGGFLVRRIIPNDISMHHFHVQSENSL
jgi:hypothetical protein